MKLLLCGIIVVLAMATTANAESLNIQFTGLDLVYDGTLLTSQTNPDELSTIAIADADGITSFTSGIDVDLNVPGLTLPLGAPAASADSASGGSLALNVPGGSIILELAPVTVTYGDVGAFQFATGWSTASIVNQSVPGLTLSDPVTFSFSQTMNQGSRTDDGTNITGFTSFGTGEIAAATPEPASAGLLGVAGVTLLCLFRRRSVGISNSAASDI